MPYGPAAHHNPVPEFGFATYRAFPAAPYGAAAPDPWGIPWGGAAAPFGAEGAFGPEPEPLLMFFELGGLGAPGPAAVPADPLAALQTPGAAGPLASLLPEALKSVRLLPEIAAGQREAGEALREALQRLDRLQRQVEALHACLAGAPSTRSGE